MTTTCSSERRRLLRYGAWGFVVVLVSFAAAVSCLRAQEPGEQAVGHGQFAGTQRVRGVVTAVSGANLTIKTEDGATYQVVTTDNTRLMRGRGVTIKLTDLKPGDGVLAMGNLDAPNKTLHAAFVLSVDAEQMKKIEEARKQELANLGKTNIMGRVAAIDLDNATMTVERPDGVSQTIGFDESTSFRRGRLNMSRMGFGSAAGAAPSANGAPVNAAEQGESITLADIKVGDRVAGPGSVKNGRFVPSELTVLTPGEVRHRGESGNGAPAAPSSAQPSPTRPQ